VAQGLIVNALAFDPQDPDIVYAACGNSAGQFAGVFKTTNEGTTWEKKDFGLPANAAIVDIKVDPDSRSTLYAATYQQGVYVSYDGGEYWILLGLSGYFLNDLAVTPSSGSSGSAGGGVSLPASRLYASSNSGFYRFSGSGLGLLSGTISDGETGAAINGATIAAQGAQLARTLRGFYGIVIPSGVFDLTINAQGYPPTTKRVSLASGESKTLNITLGQLRSTFTISGLVSDATDVVSVGTAVKFTAQTEGDGTPLSYKFWVASGYGTQSYGNWQVIQEYSANNACTWTPLTEGNYVVVAWVADDPASQNYQQVGMSLNTRGFSSQPIQILNLTSTTNHPVQVGAPITFTSQVSGGGGPIEFQYWIYDGAQWQSIQAYSTTNTCTWTPRQAGSYIIVVWVSDTQATQDPPLAGWTLSVK